MEKSLLAEGTESVGRGLASLRSYRAACAVGKRGQGENGRREDLQGNKSGSCRALKAIVRTWLLPCVRWQHLKDCEQRKDMIQPKVYRLPLAAV